MTPNINPKQAKTRAGKHNGTEINISHISIKDAHNAAPVNITCRGRERNEMEER